MKKIRIKRLNLSKETLGSLQHVTGGVPPATSAAGDCVPHTKALDCTFTENPD